MSFGFVEIHSCMFKFRGRNFLRGEDCNTSCFEKRIFVNLASIFFDSFADLDKSEFKSICFYASL